MLRSNNTVKTTPQNTPFAYFVATVVGEQI
jgi:hypothetical protein